MSAGKAMAGVALAVWIGCMAMLGGCDDLSSRRPVSPTCNVVDVQSFCKNDGSK